ncbi:hypothetical protein COO20_21575 [Thalassospira marina]|uniref:Uncharacterized protein n=2 Tax=Thalassospira marina TaxID=2048283 RepID=A0A2N3KJ16_9PROT|nr:hypothetical protein COO20_21575 [Thalassospira marina]
MYIQENDDPRGEKTDKLDLGFSFALGGFNQLQGDALNSALANYKTKIMDSVTAKSGDLTNQSIDVQQGFTAEAHHVGSFNIEAAAKGQLNHTATLDVGQVNDPVADIRVHTPEGSHDYQVKFYKDGDSTATALSPKKYDTVGKVVPKDQVQDVKDAASQRAARADGNRPEVAESYKDTAAKATDRISSNDDKNIKSTGLNRKGKGSAEELAKEAKEKGQGPDYKETARVRAEFNGMQYRNAAKSGALTGATFAAAGELYGIMSSNERMTKERCMEAAQSIVFSALKGAGRAVAVTSVQHLGQMMTDAATQAVSKTAANAAAKASASSMGGRIGQQLTKGNVAAATAAIAISLGENLYKFCNGEIDSIEFASFSIGSTIQIVGATCATGLAVPVSAFLGQLIASSVSSTAVLGTTLGALGPVAVGAVFAIAFSLAIGSFVGHFQSVGSKFAIKDITEAAAKLESGQITLIQYATSVGTLSENKFVWTDCFPFAGAISVLSEYSTRKGQLKSIQADLYSRIDQIDQAERRHMEEMMEQFKHQIHAMDLQHEQVKREVLTQAVGKFGEMRTSLDKHLELNYLLFTPMVKQYTDETNMITAEKQKEEQAQVRTASYTKEIEHLNAMIDQGLSSNAEDLQLKLQLDGALKDRVDLILPAITGFDQAYEFLLQA